MLTSEQIQRIYKSREEVKAIEAEKQRLAEANAKKRTFNLGSLLPALIAAPFTGGGSLAGTLGSFAAQALPTAIGEGFRASTGSDTDYGSLLGGVANLQKGLRPTDIASTAMAKPKDTSFMGDFLGKFGEGMQYDQSESQADFVKRQEADIAKKKMSELIGSGKVQPKSLVSQGITYDRPEVPKTPAMTFAERLLLKRATPGKAPSASTNEQEKIARDKIYNAVVKIPKEQQLAFIENAPISVASKNLIKKTLKLTLSDRTF
jgi:hypothetical protein